jgi:hypothetical protein
VIRHYSAFSASRLAGWPSMIFISPRHSSLRQLKANIAQDRQHELREGEPLETVLMIFRSSAPVGIENLQNDTALIAR